VVEPTRFEKYPGQFIINPYPDLRPCLGGIPLLKIPFGVTSAGWSFEIAQKI